MLKESGYSMVLAYARAFSEIEKTFRRHLVDEEICWVSAYTMSLRSSRFIANIDVFDRS